MRLYTNGYRTRSIFETHFKTGIVMFSFFLTTWGWFAWNAFLSGVYAKSPSGPYAIRDSFTQLWGRDPTWWATLFLVLSFLGLMELVGKLVINQLRTSGQKGSGGNMEDWDLETWQEMEHNPEVKQHLERLARDGDDEDDIYDDVMELGIDSTDLPGGKGGTFREHVVKLGSMLPSLNRGAAK
jgi:phospholipid-translocating ATPase